MITLEEKYVLHIPCYKYENNKLISLKNENTTDTLLKQLEEKGYTSLYITNIKGYYKKRSFDEILITIFTTKEDNKEKPGTIFRNWFKKNNHILQQESFAYEHNNKLIIEELKEKI